MTPTMTARLALESVRRFDGEGDELDPLDVREAVGFAGVERAFEGGWELALGATGHAWHEPERDRSTAGVTARALRVTASGVPVLQTAVVWTPLYRRAAFDGSGFLRTGRLQLRPRLRLGWGEDLPAQATFPLGGDDGFPGLHLGERRGDREALLGLMATYDLIGPFVARAELVTGRTALGGLFSIHTAG